jgi:hypothetical protein
MKRDGFEADKTILLLILKVQKMNLTANWDGTVESFKWSVIGKKSIL